MYVLAIGVAFWFLAGHGLIAADRKRVPVTLGLIWLAAYAPPRPFLHLGFDRHPRAATDRRRRLVEGAGRPLMPRAAPVVPRSRRR